MLFEDSVRRVTISEEKASWIKDVLAESGSTQIKIHDQKMAVLLSQKARIERRLSGLYDLRIDGGIDDDMFKAKENEYTSQLIDTDLAIEHGQSINSRFYEDGCRILELSNRLFPLYLRSDTMDKARILRLIASNYVLNGQTISATYSKPFCFLADLPLRPTKLPRLDVIRTFGSVLDYFREAG
jgi:hypothetical protein